ncbi:MAG: prepilin-type N-terminal cleavage/methylation domain-containing protein [bacterium]
MRKSQSGFTLIELLIVIAIIAILAAVVFVALNPLKRFQDSRDSRRAADINGLISAIKVDQVDNGGSYLGVVSGLTAGNVYMIGTAVAGCDDQNASCDTAVTADASCVDLSALITEGYIGSIPVSPNGAGTWTAATTGYTLTRASTGILTIRSCESENTTEIATSR